MGLQPTKITSTGGIPVWQKVDETAQGGFTLDTTGLTAGDKINAGTPFTYNEATRKAKPAAVNDGASDAKGALWQDTIVANGVSVDVVLRGTVYERRINNDHSDIAPEHKTALQGLIIFSKSF